VKSCIVKVSSRVSCLLRAKPMVSVSDAGTFAPSTSLPRLVPTASTASHLPQLPQYCTGTWRAMKCVVVTLFTARLPSRTPSHTALQVISTNFITKFHIIFILFEMRSTKSPDPTRSPKRLIDSTDILSTSTSLLPPIKKSRLARLSGSHSDNKMS